jgi:hypothetical protein
MAGFFDVAPHLSWLIVKGRIGVQEWDVEYGDRIDEIPIVRRILYRYYETDEKTKTEKAIPVIDITIQKAEKYLTVNPNEYEPAFYGLEAIPTDVDQPTGVPAALYVALFGMICFIVGILLLHRASRRRAKEQATDVRLVT